MPLALTFALAAEVANEKERSGGGREDRFGERLVQNVVSVRHTNSGVFVLYVCSVIG